MTELTMAELRAVQLSIFDAIDRFCRERGLNYFLAYGSLLGAVRHGGYIPWDDDLDLMMTREDYDRFCRTFSHPDLTLGAPEVTERWAYPYAKVSDKRTVLVEDTELEHEIGVNVDIFPVDHYASAWRRLHLGMIRMLLGLLLLKGLTPAQRRSRAKAGIVTLTKPFVRRIRTDVLTGRIARLAAAHRTGSQVGVLVGSRLWEVPETLFGGSEELSFEGRRARVPINRDPVLVAMYGAGYLQLPPESERHTHHAFTARWT